jgi:hypothetical protein
MTVDEFEVQTPIDSPVVLFVFNRPVEAEKVFERIRAAKPSKLFVISDGPRQKKNGESELVKRSRDIISKIDWPVELSTNFSDDNLGCKGRIASGLDWVFSQVNSAIILEDDCLPEPDFFRFTDQLLKRFEHDERIGAISGTNPLEGLYPEASSYFFSRLPSIWGWATWARVWKNYDGDILDWPAQRNSTLLSKSLLTKKAIKYWRQSLDGVYRKAIDTWDYQFTYQLFKKGQLSVVPAKNLISNIGFGPTATHTLDTSSFLANLKTSKLDFPLVHPIEIHSNEGFDQELQARFIPASWRLWVVRRVTSLPAPLVKVLRVIYDRLRSK